MSLLIGTGLKVSAATEASIKKMKTNTRAVQLINSSKTSAGLLIKLAVQMITSAAIFWTMSSCAVQTTPMLTTKTNNAALTGANGFIQGEAENVHVLAMEKV